MWSSWTVVVAMAEREGPGEWVGQVGVAGTEAMVATVGAEVTVAMGPWEVTGVVVELGVTVDRGAAV